jgi:cell division protein FtsL
VSAPAEHLPTPKTSPGRTTTRPSAPARARTTPRATEPTARPRTATTLRPRSRRGFHTAFWLFAATIVTVLLVGVVSLSAMVVQTSMQVTEVESRLRELSESHETLVTEAAELSAPGRLAEWASNSGMVAPDGVVILQVSGEAGR